MGSLAEEVLALNRLAARQMHALVQLNLVPGATHLFEEPGTLEIVAQQAATWFKTYLTGGR